MEQKQYVGILVSDKFHQLIPTGRTGPESLSLYEEACRSYGMKPCYLRIRDLTQGNTFVYAYICVKGKYRKQFVPYPKIIHNRAIFKNPGTLLCLERLIRSGTIIFNQKNRYSKLAVHQLLLQEPALLNHLPVTLSATIDNIHIMQNSFTSLVIKPVSGSIGLGIMRLRLLNNGLWELQYPHETSQKWLRVRFSSRIPNILKQRIRKRHYLVQQLLPLACYHGRPYDLRVSVQRGETGEWGVSGIVGKVAKPGSFLTNIARGGQAYPLGVLLEDNPVLNLEAVSAGIADLALRIAEHLSLYLPGLADLGLDIGITEEGLPMFIEANGRDQRYSFREAGMLEEWKSTFRTPMAYAHYLSNLYKTP